MTYVLLNEGPGHLRAARVIAEKRMDVGRRKNVRVMTCRFAGDETGRYAEGKTFKVYPSMILAEWTDEYETNSDHLNYRAAMKHLCRKWAESKEMEL